MAEEGARTVYGNGMKTLPDLLPGDEVVISGITGRFAEADNLKQMEDTLYNKVDVMSNDDRRWNLDDPEVPKWTGKMNHLEKFDAQFFGVNYKQAHVMDPVARIMMEQAYEAIVDAGVNPRTLRNTNTGVFIGVSFSDSEKACLYEKRKINGFGLAGCSRSMWANRISYWLGCTGPSYAVDTACSSSSTAMDHAYRAIRSGLCDAALVGGSNLSLHPYVNLNLYCLGVLCHDGRCKSFDEDADGYGRSEAIVMVYLQKAKDAKRIHAYVVHTRVNCDGYKEEGFNFPSRTMQSQLCYDLYNECGVQPSSLAYMEAHGTGTRVGDFEELNALGQVFCNDRTTPLLIGSVKTNLGHCEAASGLCSISKIIVAMESGFLAPNLHYKRPRKGVTALEDGRMKVVTETTPWEGGYAGVNSFGFGGANAHVLLKSHSKDKINGGAPIDDLPRLVVVSGRTEDAVTRVLDGLQTKPVDAEFVGLFHNIHREEIPGHLYRGYTILPPRGLPENNICDVQKYSGTKRPVWFVFSGIGSQWPGMGGALLQIPIFAKSIEKCDAIMKAHGVNIMNILTNNDPELLENIENTFVGIAAIQIALVDVLRALGIVPDHIIGHSAGELACSYADGSFTAEQTLLASHARALALLETKTTHGCLASIGLGYAELKSICPPDIEIACHNSAGNSTISGPIESINQFAATLKADGVFVKVVPTGNFAYHSRYIAPAGPKLLARLKKIVPDPKPRSQKWLSTSVPHDKWNTSVAQLSSAEYHTNNLLSSVLFHETCQLIPQDAITIEIAPHGLFQAILRRSLHKNVTNIALTRRDQKNHVEQFLQAVGKMYEVGLEPQLANLYPKVEYPVSRGTPMISPLVRWEHSADWYVYKFTTQENVIPASRIIKLSLSDPSYEWMTGSAIKDRVVVPAAGYLELIWETLGLMKGVSHTELSVVFEDVRFHRETVIPEENDVELRVTIHEGIFEITEGVAVVATGSIRIVSNPSDELFAPQILTTSDEDEELCLTSKDVYKELRLRGYQYTGVFCGIKSASLNRSVGRIAWINNWVTFMDNMLQMKMLVHNTRGLFVPTMIQKLVIDVKGHSNKLQTMSDDEEKEFPVQIHADLNVIVAGGVEIRGMKASEIFHGKIANVPVKEDFKFTAHRDWAKTELNVITRMATHIAHENHQGINVKTIEIIGEADDILPEKLISTHILGVLSDMPLVQGDITVMAPIDTFKNDSLPSSIRLVNSKSLDGYSDALIGIGSKLLSSNNRELLNYLKKATREAGFLLTREPLNANSNILSTLDSEDLSLVLEKRTADELILLLRKKAQPLNITAVIRVNNNEFTWLAKLQAAMKAESEKERSNANRIVLVSDGDMQNGLVGLVSCLRQEPGGELIRGVVIQDLEAPKFSLEDPLYSDRLKLDLVLNVLRPGKVWGSYHFFVKDNSSLNPVYHASLDQLVRGDLSSFEWVEGKIQPTSPHEDIIHVHYAAINCRDVMEYTGKLGLDIVAASTQANRKTATGLEYAGKDQKGRAVMGLCSEGGAFGNLCVSDRELLWPVPDKWTLQEAATVPISYGLAYYALYLTAKIKKGDKVLIHSGSGDVGQAAIAIALHEGCEIFTTVGTSEKRDFVKNRFPQIDDDHIGNSRDTSFEQLIFRQTKGRGVDVVLNSLSEDKLQASIRCLAKRGHFVNIGKFDLMVNKALGTEVLLKEIIFHGDLLENLFSDSNARKAELASILLDGIKRGVVQPLVRTVFPMEQVQAAFNFMVTGNHIGKVLLKMGENDDTSHPSRPLAIPRYYCSENGSFIIHGGLGGFGLELANWLVVRGAKKLVLTSQRGIVNGYQRMRIAVWKSCGVETIVVVGKDASTQEGCEATLKEAIALGPVEAIFILAAVLKDGICENQTTKSFQDTFRAKAWSTVQFDKLSRTMCPHLKKFVVFSSVSCGRGYPGQVNYGMANSITERVCEKRVMDNLPGLAIQWGALADVGITAKNQVDHKQLVIQGTMQQKLASCLQELDRFINQNSPVVSCMIVAEKNVTEIPKDDNIVDAVLHIMGLNDLNSLSLRTPLSELGMDSMMTLEIRQTFERVFAVHLTAYEIRGLNFEKLQEMSLKQSKDVEDPESKTTTAAESLKANDVELLIQNPSTYMNGEVH